MSDRQLSGFLRRFSQILATSKARYWSNRIPVLLGAITLVLAAPAEAASVTTLHAFAGNGVEGSFPFNNLVLATNGKFYGVTDSGGVGSTNGGTIFSLDPATGTFTTLHSFAGASEGSLPVGLIQGSDGNFYGTTEFGGAGFGTVFKFDSTNNTLTTLYSFTNGTDGAEPRAGVIQGSDGLLYGTTQQGANTTATWSNGCGTVFSMTTSGVLHTLHRFTDSGGDGCIPAAPLVQSTNDGNFYSTTVRGGTGENGTAFKITTAGVLTTLHQFTGVSPEGVQPAVSVALTLGNDGNFYGTTFGGGVGGVGTVFKMTPGGAVTTLHGFSTATNDGDDPRSSLVQAADGNFYGTTYSGGSTGNGTVYRLTPSGTFSLLYSFAGGSEGSQPESGLTIGADSNFYGSTINGGVNDASNPFVNDKGTLFKLSTSVSPAATPTFLPVAGTYTSVQSVAIGDTTAGATIYFTTDGTMPTTASTMYSAPISVAANTTINAIAVATGFTNSAVATAAYIIHLPTAATPTLSPVAGTYTATQSVTISDTTPGATLYYTTDGSMPTTASTMYSAPISVAANTTINAIAVATGFTNSAVATAAYILHLPTAATPTLSPVAGTYTATQSVTISDTTPGATLYYTTDGSMPTTSSTIYVGAFSVSASETVKAIADATDYVTSGVATASYVINSSSSSSSSSSSAGGGGSGGGGEFDLNSVLLLSLLSILRRICRMGRF